MSSLRCTITSALLLGCAAAHDRPAAESDAATAVSDAGPGPAITVPDASVLTDVCAGDASFDIRVALRSVGDAEGLRVWLSAVEAVLDADDRAREVVVRREARVMGGAVELACSRSLSENFTYPSFAIVLDADDDGHCSDGDLFMESQRYGWAGDVVETFDLSDPHTSWHPVADTTTTFAEPVCAFYLP